nr:MAG TPA: Intercellular adhesion protein R family, intercellular adhesion regulator [Caudoviricetes sp.]
MEFMRDILSNNMSLREVAIKYNMKIDDVYQHFMNIRSQYTQEEIEGILNDVYYK